MKVKLVGFSGVRSGEFNGRPYTLRKLSYVECDEKTIPRDYEGSRAGEMKVNGACMAKLDMFKPGDIVNLYFDKFGKIDEIVAAE